jgi:hypothetical protein
MRDRARNEVTNFLTQGEEITQTIEGWTDEQVRECLSEIPNAAQRVEQAQLAARTIERTLQNA